MFIKNQTVWCAMFGKGVVARISHKGAKFPVVVNFGGLMERCYSLEGKYEQLYATQPTLFPYPIEIIKIGQAVKKAMSHLKTKQPDALRLADCLEGYATTPWTREVVAAWK